MEMSRAAHAFSALGHPDRLAVFRLVMRFAPGGVRPTEIAGALGIRPNTLSHHLADLSAAGLLRCERRGRSLLYSADLGMTETLIGYLARDVGRGRPDLLSVLQPLMEMPAMQDGGFNVLFLCTGNSARSVMAEALLRDLGGERFRAHSAGLWPKGAIHPLALDVLARNGHDTRGLRPKGMAEVQAQGAPAMDFVFTLCDRAAAEDCPAWAGQPITGHWGLPDPAGATGTEAERALAFAQCHGMLRRRIAAFVALPFGSLSRMSLQARVDALATQGEG